MADPSELDKTRTGEPSPFLAGEPQVPPEPALQLVISIEGRVEVFAITDAPELALGRSPGPGVKISHASVSRRHALLRRGPPLTIEDLSSSNGTWVRGQRLLPGCREVLSPGQVFGVGDCNVWLEVQRPDEPDSPQPFVIIDGERIGVTSTAMRALLRTIDRVAPGAISVMLHGETGVGKEVIARTIHARSRRAHAPFLGLNCAALSETLLESELFGYEKGAFTGAHESKPGLLENAHGGTVLLDELGELPLSSQAKLLRCIEEREVLRLGGLKPRPIDVRLIGATNRDLRAEVDAGRFRKDLYFRLNGLLLEIPPLRERRQEVIPLALHFLRGSAARQDQPAPTLSPAALRSLERHDWPGNVRELRAVIDRAVLLSGGSVIEVEHLAIVEDRGGKRQGATSGAAAPDPTRPAARAADPEPADSSPVMGTRTPGPMTSRDLKDELQAVERDRIIAALEACGGNQSRAAKVLGISRNTLVRRIAEYDLPRPRKRGDAS